MSLDVDVTTNGERLALSRTRLIEIAQHVLRGNAFATRWCRSRCSTGERWRG